MSFVKKALKKVWKTVKKVVKSKVFKYIAVAAAVFFTAGIASAGGFAAFTSAVGTAGGGIGGFFTAVGQTIATGASALASMAGLKGTSATLAGYGGSMAGAAGLAGAPVTAANLLTPIAVTATKIPAGVTSIAAHVGAGGGGFAATIGKFLAKPILGDVTTGQLLANGAMAGITSVLNAKANEKEYPNSFVAGGLARGGSSSAPDPFTYKLGSAPEIGTSSATAQPEQSVAASLANNVAPPEGAPDAGQAPTTGFAGARASINAISGRLAQRDNRGGLVPNPEFQQPGEVLIADNGSAPPAPAGTFGPFYDQASRIQYQNRRGV